MPRYIAEFAAQAWVNNNAIRVDPEGPTTWDATAYVNANYTPEQIASLLEDGDRDDNLRTDPEAPEWVREYHGPFDTYLEIEEDDV